MAKAQEKETERTTLEKKAKMAEEQAKTYIFSTLDNISRAKNLIENQGAGGAYEGAFPGVMNKLGRPETMQLIAAYKQIASNVLLDQIYRLKEVSPTGATGLGATSNLEINKLSERLGELNPELPAAAQIQILNDVERSLKNLSGNPIIENEYSKYQEELRKQSPVYRQQEAQREEAKKRREEEEAKQQRRNLLMQNFGTK
jgi:DNA-directed RNA polymerase beta' subunit